MCAEHFRPRPHDPPTARSAPAQRAAHEPTGTLHRHAACSPAASRPPPPAPRNVPASRRARPRISTRSMRRASCPKSQARGALAVSTLILRLPAAVRVANPALPASARYVAPRRRGVAALRALRCAQARASAATSPRAGRAQAAPRCWAAPTRAERVAALRASVGVRARHPAASAFCGRRVCALTPFASVALRAKSAAAPPRSARTRRVRLRLAPSPCSRRRAKPPAPFACPSRAAASRFRRHPATPAASPSHDRRRTAQFNEGSALRSSSENPKSDTASIRL
jgi:hypothetical protein